MQWFRFYTEAISDKKLRRIARDNNESMAYVIGVWTIVLSMASDSPDRGRLMISGEVPATIDDISDAAGCNVTETFQKLLVTGLVTVDVTDDGQNVYVVPAWDKRQFESDSSATRVRKHRERKKSAESSANVTGMKRYSNAPDTDTEVLPTVPADAVPTAPTPPEIPLSKQFAQAVEELKTSTNKQAVLHRIYVMCYGEQGAPDFGYLGKVARQVGGAGHLAQLLWQHSTRPPVGDVLAYIISEHKAKEKRAYTNGANRAVTEVRFAQEGDDIYA